MCSVSIYEPEIAYFPMLMFVQNFENCHQQPHCCCRNGFLVISSVSVTNLYLILIIIIICDIYIAPYSAR